MNDSKTLFTELTANEEASLCGGKKPDNKEKRNKLPKIVNIYIDGDIIGAGGGAGTGGAIGGSSGNATAGPGVVIFG
ncbi:hypothetical protein IQ277_18545 [Nostocales cyanobacterium LEGE 12452]|nr:hypothetical protein [Nostocales cyanobacterium LEGE 12452]